MRKLLRTQDILLLGLANALDIFEEIKDPLHLVSNSYKNMYGWVPKRYKRSNFAHLLWRSFKAGYIEKIEKNNELYIRITSRGNKKIQRDFPLLSFQKRAWDGKWRALTFDIEETNKNTRDVLRNKLRELGFGMLQESVFITPHDILKDISEFVESSHLAHYVYLLEVSRIVVGEERELANHIWKLNEINNKYTEIIGEIQNSHLTKYSGRDKKLNVKLTSKVRKIKNMYLETVLQDPFLPKSLLPVNWHGNEAKRLVGQLPL